MQADATLFNLSLLTSDGYALLYRYTVLKQTVREQASHLRPLPNQNPNQIKAAISFVRCWLVNRAKQKSRHRASDPS